MTKIDEKFVFEPTAFDYVNQKAEVVIVGITPGNSQLKGEREGFMSQGQVNDIFTNITKGNYLMQIADYLKVNIKIEAI